MRTSWNTQRRRRERPEKERERERERERGGGAKREGKCRDPTANSFVSLGCYAQKRNDQPLYAHASHISVGP